MYCISYEFMYCSPSSMAVYLLEPHTCEYVLGVETSIVCPLLQHADHLGMFKSSLPPDAAQVNQCCVLLKILAEDSFCTHII